jgi:hypothetical protein
MAHDDPWEKSVQAHGSLEQVAPGLHWVWAPCPGAPVTRNMSVYELPGGGLLVHSAICMNDAEMAKLDALGEVRYLLVPNEGHRIDIKRWKKRYPKAPVLAPKNASAKVGEVVPVDQSAEEALAPLGIRIHAPDGMKEGYELVYEVDLKGGGRALIVNDVLVGPHPHPPRGFGGFMSGLLGPPGGLFGQARIVRTFFGKDRAKFRGFVEKLSRIEDLRAIVTSHGGPMTENVSGELTGAIPRL